MTLTPSYDDFAAQFEAGKNQLIYTRLAADLDTPVSLMLKLGGRKPTVLCWNPSLAVKCADDIRSLG